MLLKYVYLKLFFPRKVTVRNISQKIGGMTFLMELVLLMIFNAYFRVDFLGALF